MRKILIADDDPGTREFYKVLFEDAGYSVMAVEDPEGAAMCCHNFEPDLLLLDWDMPGGGGKRVYELVAARLGRKVPVIFATGFPEHVSFRSASHLLIMKKPASMASLLEEAEKMLSDKK